MTRRERRSCEYIYHRNMCNNKRKSSNQEKESRVIGGELLQEGSDIPGRNSIIVFCTPLARPHLTPEEPKGWNQ